MRLKHQTLIAFGISTIIFSGCTSSGGGFLNLGVADAFRKSQANIFKKRLTYSKTPIGNTGFALPTFGTQTAVGSSPVEIDSYTIQQSIPSVPQVGSAAPAESCGCSADTVISTEQFYMPQHQHVAEPVISNVVPPQTPTEIITAPSEATSNSLPQTSNLPEANPLPSDGVQSQPEAVDSDNFEKFDTEGTLEPLGQIEKDDEDFETDSPEEIANGQRDQDQSIFEQAEISRRSRMKLDASTAPSPTTGVAELQKPKLLVLHARPAQSHNVYNQVANTRKPLTTVQASHKPYYRQQNSLRQQPTKLNDRGYREARNTSSEIQFKPLPPVSETPPAAVLTPTTKMAPLQESDIDFGKQNDAHQGTTRTADATANETVKTTPRLPILRATTVSSASILSLKNLANVIDTKQSQKNFYEANRHTAQGTTTNSIEVLKSGEATVER